MDYRDQIVKFGNRINRAITDQKFIAWLIQVLKLEGFGNAKVTSLNPGYGIGITLESETETEKVYKVGNIDVVSPDATLVFVQDSFEYGEVVAIGALDIDITLLRNTYPLTNVDFSGIDVADLNTAALNGTGINADLNTQGTHLIEGASNEAALTLGASSVGSIVITDSHSRVTTVPIAITRQNRYIFGICQGVESAADIVTALASVTGDISPEDQDATFLSLTSALGDLPASFDVDTLGETRTFFIASQDVNLQLKLVTGLPYNLPKSTQTINLNSISGGAANISRLYNVYNEDFNANFTLYTN